VASLAAGCDLSGTLTKALFFNLLTIIHICGLGSIDSVATGYVLDGAVAIRIAYE
jgi:hypothetical protein